jgi:hypothetical protein
MLTNKDYYYYNHSALCRPLLDQRWSFRKSFLYLIATSKVNSQYYGSPEKEQYTYIDIVNRVYILMQVVVIGV